MRNSEFSRDEVCSKTTMWYHSLVISGCGVTANMLVLGTSDSGFESRHPDI